MIEENVGLVEDAELLVLSGHCLLKNETKGFGLKLNLDQFKSKKSTNVTTPVRSCNFSPEL